VIALRPLREDEYEAWDAAHRREYLHGLVESAGMAPDEAAAKVRRDVDSVFPEGLATPGRWIWVVEHTGRRVGTLFLGLREGQAWLYDITIDEAERGKGFGRAAMLALEDAARGLGFESVGLNVWGGNAAARGLYRSLGWREDSVHMSKRL
jgi:ribosomal protein S18 acetylase RimI-like enzyme